MNHHTATRTRKAHIAATYEAEHGVKVGTVHISGGIVTISDKSGDVLARLTAEEARRYEGKKKRPGAETPPGR